VLVSFARQFERESQYTIYAAPGEDRLLHDGLVFRPLVDAAADIRIFPFVVLSHDYEIDLTGLPILQRTLDAIEKPNRP
jgi:hypothetical protein